MGMEGSISKETINKVENSVISSNISANNNLNIISKNDLNISSSNLITNNGEINLTSQEGNVDISAAANRINSSHELKTGAISLTFGIGNAHVDTAYAAKDAYDAAKEVEDAKKELNRMETKYKNGEATKDALSDAKDNLKIALLNVALAYLKLSTSAAKSAGSKESVWTGL